MKYYLFLDDSGQLHKNYPIGNHFVYGGLLIEENEYHKINKNYKNLVKKIKQEKGIESELKTSIMDIETRRRLLKRMSQYPCVQVFVSVDVSKIVRLDFHKKKDVVRFKNYVVRRLIEKLMKEKKIPKECNLIEVQIDNQNIAHSAIDSLEDHLYHFFNDDNYYFIHKRYNTTTFYTDFKVHYKDSESNYMIQAADLLANTEFNALEKNSNIRKLYKNNYVALRLP